MSWCPLTLAAAVGLFCWGFREDGAAFDRSGSRTWMRAREKAQATPSWCCTSSIALILLEMFIETYGKWPISTGREEPFMQSQPHQADRNSLIPLFMQLCPLFKLHQPFCDAHT